MRLKIISFTEKGAEQTGRLCKKLNVWEYECTGYTLTRLAGKHGLEELPENIVEWIGKLWGECAFVFVGAAGIAVRMISPWVKDKFTDSPVIVMDEKGQKMSKSLWNAVAPGEITKKYGADILRLWACSVDYQADVSMGQNILKQVSDNYRKVRNTFRFLMANLDNNEFSKKDCIPFDQLNALNQYILVLLKDASDFVIKAYKEYRFSDVVSYLSNLMTNDLSAYYLDYTKDILYIENVDSLSRREVQTVLYTAVDVLAKLWSPILCHTCEEINDFMHFNSESIHLESFDDLQLNFNGKDIKDKMKVLFEIRKDVFKALEEKRADKLIGKPLEAKVLLHVSEQQKAVIDEMLDNVPQWFTVSQVEFVQDTLPSYEVCQVQVEKAQGSVCPRCWNITKTSHEDGLCNRCYDVLNK